MKRFMCWLIAMVLILLPVMGLAKPDSDYTTYRKMIEPLAPEIIVERRSMTVQGDTAYFYLQSMDFADFYQNLAFLRPFVIKKIVLNLFSFGGSLFDAMAMTSLLREYERSGIIIEVHARGLVASAGLLLLIAGSQGHRYIDTTSIVMFHELQSFKLFVVETPSNKEEEARIYRFIQDVVNKYIISRSKISMDELKAKIQQKEFWMTAAEAIQFGFADGFLK